MSDSDYVRLLAEAFIDRRGRGTSLSSADQQLLLEWEAAGVPIDLVQRGIEDAFLRRRDAPPSIRACRRWVEDRWRRHQEAQRAGLTATTGPMSAPLRDDLGLGPAVAFGGGAAADRPLPAEPTDPSTDPHAPRSQGWRDVAPALFDALLSIAANPAMPPAAQRAADELVAQAQEAAATPAGIDADWIMDAPDRLADAAWTKLGPEEQAWLGARLESELQRVRAASPVARQRAARQLRTRLVLGHLRVSLPDADDEAR